jgi:hypothetical protein
MKIPAERSEGLPAKQLSKATNLVVIALLVLACLHCSRAIFFQNVSWIDLHAYSIGQERKPFQERVAMMPFLRAAGSSPLMQKAAAAIDKEDRHQLGRAPLDAAEPFSAEKLASVLIGMVCSLIAVAFLIRMGRKFEGLYWLAPAIFLVILYVSYAARYEEAYWYPYDLPHMLLFGAACLCLFEGPLWLVLPLFILDVPMRETSIYLVLIAAPFFAQRWKWKVAAAALVGMAAYWVVVRLAISRAFALNDSETGSRLLLNLKNLALPLHWPQMASALGFLLIPVFLGRSYLPMPMRRFLYTMIPCLLVTAWFGMWIESRITLEWSMPLAYLATLELLGYMRQEPLILHG